MLRIDSRSVRLAVDLAAELTALIRTVRTLHTLAAVGGQKTNQLIDGREVGAVDPRPPLPLAPNQAGTPQFLQMKGKGRGRDVEGGSDGSSGQPFRPGLHERSEHIEPGFVCEGGQGADGDLFFHNSNAIEISIDVNLINRLS